MFSCGLGFRKALTQFVSGLLASGRTLRSVFAKSAILSWFAAGFYVKVDPCISLPYWQAAGKVERAKPDSPGLKSQRVMKSRWPVLNH